MPFVATTGRYATGQTLVACKREFHRDMSAIGRIIAIVEEHIYSHCNESLHVLHELLVTRVNLNLCKDAGKVAAKGGLYGNVWGSLDGCKWPICGLSTRATSVVIASPSM